MPDPNPLPGDDIESTTDSTRQSLIDSALERFGAKGYDAASTREIAAAASTNIGSIAYYFGGKEGLRRACAEHVVRLIRSVARAALGDEAVDGAAPPSAPDEARQRLEAAVRRLARFLFIQPQARLIVPFILREIANPSIALDIIYAGVMAPTHRRFCRLWAAATGEDPDSENVRLATFAMVGQVLYFRIGQAIITRRMDWLGYGPSEVEAVTAILVRNLHASLDANRSAHAGRKAAR